MFNARGVPRTTLIWSMISRGEKRRGLAGWLVGWLLPDRLPDCQPTRQPGYWSPQFRLHVHRPRPARLGPSLSAWAAGLPGCLAAWLPGCMAAWLPGCLAARLPGCACQAGKRARQRLAVPSTGLGMWSLMRSMERLPIKSGRPPAAVTRRQGEQAR